MSDQTRIGDKVSGDGESPCAHILAGNPAAVEPGPALPDAPAPAPSFEDVARYTRMLRPFPIKALSNMLFHVEQTAVQISTHLIALQIDPPREAETWANALWSMDNLLWELADYAEAARLGLPEMVDRSDTEAERAAVALRAIFDGLAARAPKPCPSCDGHGGWESEGACPTCQGSAIDPSDPASPL